MMAEVDERGSSQIVVGLECTKSVESTSLGTRPAAGVSDHDELRKGTVSSHGHCHKMKIDDRSCTGLLAGVVREDGKSTVR